MSGPYSNDPCKNQQHPGATAAQILVVESPADLPEGYTFDAVVDGKTYAVRVPAGGVVTGQKFSAPVPGATTTYATLCGTSIDHGVCSYAGGQSALSDLDAVTFTNEGPIGAWRDSLSDCCILGPCHGLLWNALLCPQIALAQVMNRMSLTWRADPGPPRETNRTPSVILSVVLLFTGALSLLMLVHPGLTIQSPDDVSAVTLKYLVLSSFALFTVAVLTKTRAAVRTVHGIQEDVCVGCEDCCCAAFCTCCVVAQMGRHVVDYRENEYLCCPR